jgi:hypothetical protein
MKIPNEEWPSRSRGSTKGAKKEESTGNPSFLSLLSFFAAKMPSSPTRDCLKIQAMAFVSALEASMALIALWRSR